MDSDQNRNSDNTLLAALSAYKKGFYSVGIFSAIINILMLAPSLYMLQVYDRVLSSSNSMTLLMLTLLVMGLYLFMGTLEWIRSLVVIQLGTRLDLRLNQRVFNAGFKQNLQQGDLRASQVLNDLITLRQFATGHALFALFDAPWFLLFLGVVFLLHLWLGILTLIGTLVLLALAWLNHRRTHRPLEAANRIALQATHQASADLRNADAIEAMGMLGNIRRRWLTQHHAFLEQQNLASERVSSISAWSKYVRMALQSLLLGLGALLVLKGEITGGMMIAGSILAGRVLSPIDQLIAVWKQWSAIQQAYRRLQRLLHHYPPSPEHMALPAPIGALSVEHLTYRPNNSQPIRLLDIHFSLPVGETLGILGSSGSGKSTLARLLLATLAPTQGYVRLDGADLHQSDKQTLGPYLGYLPQNIQLFSGTLAENIARFGEPDAEKVVAAAKMAGVHDMILALPQGYDQVLGENGHGLSGGQQQRIALARAIYGIPRLIVLDELNANLDREGDSALCTALQMLKQHKCTLILITHRPELIQYTDKLLILHQGQVMNFGPRQQVLGTLQKRNIVNKAPTTV